jgi:hypothetical protein
VPRPGGRSAFFIGAPACALALLRIGESLATPPTWLKVGAWSEGGSAMAELDGNRIDAAERRVWFLFKAARRA